MELISREVEAAQARGLTARLLVPLTRGQGGASLHYEVELQSLDALDDFRSTGIGSAEHTGDWMHELSGLLTAPSLGELCARSEGATPMRVEEGTDIPPAGASEVAGALVIQVDMRERHGPVPALLAA
jgi:hypothetical protein